MRSNSFNIMIITSVIFLTMSLVFSHTILANSTPVWPTVWLTPDCNTDPSDKSPSQLDIISVDIIGDSYHPAVYYAEDDNFLYLRERVEGDPNGQKGKFTQHHWVVVDEQTGDNYYDYLFTLNGEDEMVQIRKNTIQLEEINWSPIFNDPADNDPIWEGSTDIYARIDSVGDYWFVSWAIPKSYGEFTLGSDPTLYFATSANANNYNKDHLNCYEEQFCGDGIVLDPEQCEYPDTFDNEYCSQTIQECLGPKLGTRDAYGDCNLDCSCGYDTFTYQCVEGQCGAECDQDEHCPQETEKCDYVNKLYCTRDEYGTCDENCECLEDNWNCNEEDYCLNCAHCGDDIVNCGEECEPGLPSDKRCLPESAIIYYCINTTSYETPEFDSCNATCQWGNCEEIVTENDERCKPLSPPTCSGRSFTSCLPFNTPSFNFERPDFSSLFGR